MKKTIPILFLLLTLAGSRVLAADTLHCRFNDFMVIDGTPYDTLVFDVEMRTSTAGTYLCITQLDVIFNKVVFGANAKPYSIEELGLISPAMFFPAGPTNPTDSSFRYGKSGFPPFDPTTLTLMPTTGWGELMRIKMLVLNNSQPCRVSFSISAMTGNQKFVKSYSFTSLTYSPFVADNHLKDFPSTPTVFNLMISELGDPTDSGADFVEIYNPGPNKINFSQVPWYLTMYNGSTYQSARLSGSVSAGMTHVVAGPSFAAAFPGKPASQIASFIENGGTVSYYLSVFGDYSAGTTIDIYNGGSLPYTGKQAVRPYGIESPNDAFTPAEWHLSDAATMDMTPGSHRATVVWDGSSDEDWRDTTNWTRSFVPDVGHNVRVPEGTTVFPVIEPTNIARCHNLQVEVAPPPEE